MGGLQTANNENTTPAADATCERRSRPRQRYQHNQPHTPLHQQQLEEIKSQYLSYQHDITIDRDTVLKINRLATRRNLHKRDHSWPPPAEEAQLLPHTRSSSTDNVVHFDSSVCKRRGIDAIREKFNSPTRIIEPTAREVRHRRKMAASQQPQREQQKQRQQQQQFKKNAANKSTNVNTLRNETVTNACNNKDNTSSTKLAETKSDWTQLAHAKLKVAHKIDDGHVVASVAGRDESADMAADAANTPITKGFSAPETKAADENIGLVEPKREYYEKLATSDAKRWRSYENIASSNRQQTPTPTTIAAPSPATTTAAINNNRQSYSLERGRSKQRHQQLPPLKPRSGSGGSGVSGVGVISGSGCSTISNNNISKSPKLQRRSIKLATEIKICYDTDAEAHDVRSSAPPTDQIPQIGRINYKPRCNQSDTMNVVDNQHLNESIKSKHSGVTDLEHIPLPPTPLLSTTPMPTPATLRPSETTTAVAAKTQVSDARKRHVDTTATALTTTGKMQHQVAGDRSRREGSYNYYSDAATARDKKQQLHKKRANLTPEPMQRTHIIPVTVEQRNDNIHDEHIHDNTPNIATGDHRRPQQDLSTISVQEIYDDACIYLRSLDLQDNTVAYIPAAITIVPSPAEEMFQRWREPSNLRAAINTTRELEGVRTTPPPTQSPTPLPPSPPPPPPRPMVKQAVSSATTVSTPSAITKSPISAQSNENLIQTTKGSSAQKQESMAHVSNLKNDNISSDLAEQPTAEAPTYVTRLPATPHGIQLSRQASVAKLKSEPSTPQPQPQPEPHPLPDITTPLGRVNNTTIAADPWRSTSISTTTSGESNTDISAAKKTYQQDIYYSRGVTVDSDDQQESLKLRTTLPLHLQSVSDIRTAKSQIDIEISNEFDGIRREHDELQEQTNKIEIAALEAKYGQIQQSIAEHLKQIDAYMANVKVALNRTLHQDKQLEEKEDQAKGKERTQPPTGLLRPQVVQENEPQKVAKITDMEAELWQLLAARQSPILLVETPLQSVLRHIYRKTSLPPQSRKTDGDANEVASTQIPNPVENMPIVEQALLDLSNIAASIFDYEAKLVQNTRQADIRAATVDGSPLKPLLQQLVLARCPTGEHLAVEHSTAPTAATPTHVTIDEDAAEDEVDTVADRAPTKIDAKFPIEVSETNKQNRNAPTDAAQEELRLEHVANVVANYEQLAATAKSTLTKENVATLHNLHNASADRAYAMSKQTPVSKSVTPTAMAEVEAVALAMAATPTTPATPKDASKNVVSGFIASRQSQEDIVEQVIDILDAQSNQALASSAVANLNQQRTLSQQQSVTYNEEDVAILPQPQKNIISASTNASNGEGTQAPPTITGNNHTAHAHRHVNDAANDVATDGNYVDVDVDVDDGDGDGYGDADANETVDKQLHHAEHGFDNSEQSLSAGCPMCGSASAAGGTWAKLTFADQWRLENLHHHGRANDNFDTYKATYEIPSPYISRQISWEDTLPKCANTQANEVQIAHGETMLISEPATKSQKPSATDALIATAAYSSTRESTPHPSAWALDSDGDNTPSAVVRRAPTKPTIMHSGSVKTTKMPALEQHETHKRSAATQAQALRKYPAPLIEPSAPPPRAASPFGLNALDISAVAGGDTNASSSVSGIGSRSGYAAAASAPVGAIPERTRTASPMPVHHSNLEGSKYAYVPQVEGHNIGLLVRTAMVPLQPIIQEHSSVSPSPPPPLPLQQADRSTAGLVTNVDSASVADDNAVDVNDELLQHFNTIATSSTATIDTRTASSTLSPVPSPSSSASASPSSSVATTIAMRNVRARNRKSSEGVEKVRSLSQPPPFEYLMQHHVPLSLTHNSTEKLQNFTIVAPSGQQQPQQQQQHLEQDPQRHGPATLTHWSTSREGSVINRSFDNVSPRPYITIEGYKRVAWPPVSEERIIREFTPQPQSQTPQAGPQAGPQPTQYQQQHHQQYQQQHQPQHQHQQQQQPSGVAPAQGPIYNNVQPDARQNSPYPNTNHYQPQQQQPEQQPQQQQYPQAPYQQAPPQQHQQQPTQYTQNPGHAAGAPSYQTQPNQQPQYQHQQHQPQYPQAPQHTPYEPALEPTSPSGWKPIQPPLAKQQNEYYNSVGSEPNYPVYAPAQHQQQQLQQQQQYRAPSYDNYQHQQPSQPQNPAPQYHQQPQQYQPPPQNQYQYQAPQQKLPPQQPQQQPAWAHQQQQPQYQPQQQYQAPSNYQYQPQQQHYPTEPQANHYNSYSQPQQQQQQQHPHQPISQDQTDYQQHAPDYRGASPGIITLRKETPVSQQPAPVYNSQPAAVSFQGGSNMRGDLKWPPPEYKEAAVRENEERRKLALGPVCRPRKVNRDYTPFFAKNALNSYYPTYKVPPGTQHMLA